LSESRINSLSGELKLPADKSITHRAILFSVLGKGKTQIHARGVGRDNLASVRAIGQLGVSASISCSGPMAEIAKEEDLEVQVDSSRQDEVLIEIDSPGFTGLSSPDGDIYCGNSGTTSRLLTGILSALDFQSRLTGDSSLSARPFQRVKTPLEKMGAKFSADKLPIEIKGGELEAIDFESPRASAQVKSAILLAGLAAKGRTSVKEPHLSRDHTERMLSAMGAEISSKQESDGWSISVSGPAVDKLSGLGKIIVPGDLSSAAFFMVAASVIPDSKILLRNCGMNTTRAGIVKVLKMMGAEIDILNQRIEAGEEVADIAVTSSELQGVEIGAEEVVEAIDEIPIIAVAAAFASGKTTISGAAELRVKETDRLSAVANLLQAADLNISEKPDGLLIEGIGVPEAGALPSVFAEDSWKGSHDHRIEMVASIVDLVSGYPLQVSDIAAVETSFPSFIESFNLLLEG